MSFLKRSLTNPKISWIIINIEDDGFLSEQTREGKTILSHGLGGDNAMGYELFLTDKDKIALRWDASPTNTFQIEVDASGINRSLFDDAEPLRLVAFPNRLVPKEEFCWYKEKTKDNKLKTDNDEPVQIPIPPDRLDNTYELYRIVYYFEKLCLTMTYDREKMAESGIFYIVYPGTDDSKTVFKRLFSAYLKQSHLLPDNAQWSIILCDEVDMEQTVESREITTIEGEEDDISLTYKIEYGQSDVIRMKTKRLAQGGILLVMEITLYDKSGKALGEPIVFQGL